MAYPSFICFSALSETVQSVYQSGEDRLVLKDAKFSGGGEKATRRIEGISLQKARPDDLRFELLVGQA